MSRAPSSLPHTTLVRSTLALVIMGTSLVCACRPMAPEAEEGVTDVSMVATAFVPKEVTIKVGESVHWTNLESVPVIIHTATSGDPSDEDPGSLFDSGNLAPGESYTFQFDEAGEYEYFCIPHQNIAAMRHAKVNVEE